MSFGIRSLFGGKGKGNKEVAPVQEEKELPETTESLEMQTPERIIMQNDTPEDPPVPESIPEQEVPVEAKESAREEGAQAAEEEQPRRPTLRVRPKNSRELFMDALPERSRYASTNLRSHLIGKIAFEIKSSGTCFTVDWTGEELKSIEGPAESPTCTVKISESDLMRIASGDLNPQIAMLSHKVYITGNPDHAVYAFNLIAPVANI